MKSASFFVYPIALVLSVAVCGPAIAQTRPLVPIAYVSVQRILNEADDAKAAAKELEAARAATTEDLNAKKQALAATRLQIANAGGFFSSSKKAGLLEVAKRQEAELQQATQQAQVGFHELQRKVQDRLRSELSVVVTALATQRGFQYVLNQDVAVLLAPAGLNITDEVLARLNTASAQREANAKTAAAQAAPAKPAAK